MTDEQTSFDREYFYDLLALYRETLAGDLELDVEKGQGGRSQVFHVVDRQHDGKIATFYPSNSHSSAALTDFFLASIESVEKCVELALMGLEVGEENDKLKKRFDVVRYLVSQLYNSSEDKESEKWGLLLHAIDYVNPVDISDIQTEEEEESDA